MKTRSQANRCFDDAFSRFYDAFNDPISYHYFFYYLEDFCKFELKFFCFEG